MSLNQTSKAIVFRLQSFGRPFRRFKHLRLCTRSAFCIFKLSRQRFHFAFVFFEPPMSRPIVHRPYESPRFSRPDSSTRIKAPPWGQSWWWHIADQIMQQAQNILKCSLCFHTTEDAAGGVRLKLIRIPYKQHNIKLIQFCYTNTLNSD